MSQAKKKKAAASARSKGSGTARMAGRLAAAPRDAPQDVTPSAAASGDVPTGRDSRPAEPGGETIPAGLGGTAAR